MKNKIQYKQSLKARSRSTAYRDEPIEAKVVSDFLPSPDNLILKEKKRRVTLTLTDKSLDFFKKAAKKHKASYQGMIRNLIDYYVANQRV